MLEKLILAGGGGFVGAVARVALGNVVARHAPAGFPYATFLVNVTGCLAIGFLAVFTDEKASLGPKARVFLITGVLGGYTTFSAFGYETTLLLRQGSLGGALVNVFGQVLLGLVALWLGAVAARAAA